VEDRVSVHQNSLYLADFSNDTKNKIKHGIIIIIIIIGCIMTYGAQIDRIINHL
jgi:hypothetical protein